MDTNALVKRLIIDGLRLIRRLIEDEFKVVAAFWVKETEDGRWDLCISSPVVDQEGPLASYRTVLATLRSLAIPMLSSTLIRLLGQNHLLTNAVINVPSSDKIGRRVTHVTQILGGLPIDEAYVYNLDAIKQMEDSASVEGMKSQPVLPRSEREIDPTQGTIEAEDNNDIDEEESETTVERLTSDIADNKDDQ